MSRTTVFPLAWTALGPSPVRTFTTAACARRLAAVHTWANWSLCTTLATTSCTPVVRAVFSGPVSSRALSATRGGAPTRSRALESAAVRPATSTLSTTRLVSRSVTASCTAGSVARGATVWTYRSVSATSSCAQVATTASGASSTASTSSTDAAAYRSRRWRTATALRSRSYSWRSTAFNGGSGGTPEGSSEGTPEGGSEGDPEGGSEGGSEGGVPEESMRSSFAWSSW
ncbi:hypothetical protein AB0E27_14880 [Streptomyces sparsogenes]|uniref:hypothetical protein n=1 Tax=Streptomyces sparsogenes TaxID=67365 RepID=UPI0033DA20F9